MKGLCAGLGDEKGFAFGDLGEGNVRGGGIENAFLEEDALPKEVAGTAVAALVPPPKALLLELLAIAAANGLDLAYEENPPEPNSRHTRLIKMHQKESLCQRSINLPNAGAAGATEVASEEVFDSGLSLNS